VGAELSFAVDIHTDELPGAEEAIGLVSPIAGRFTRDSSD